MADLTSVLDKAGVKYEVLSHAHTERASDEAEALGLPPRAVAKTLVLDAAEGHVRVVLPASERIDLRKVRDYVEGGKKHIRLATEDELASDYPEFELGAVPPFGGGGDRVLVDARIAEQPSVVLEAGTHEKSVRLTTADLLELTKAEVVDICKEE